MRIANLWNRHRRKPSPTFKEMSILEMKHLANTVGLEIFAILARILHQLDVICA